MNWHVLANVSVEDEIDVEQPLDSAAKRKRLTILGSEAATDGCLEGLTDAGLTGDVDRVGIDEKC